MRSTRMILALVGLSLLALSGCGSSAEDGFREGFEAAQASQSAQASASPTSSAPAPVQQLTVPEGLEGKNGAIALDDLKRAGFTNVQPATNDENDRVVLNPANWEVTEVEPGAGQQAASDSPIIVTMTKQ